jgi:hypothetical protein
MAITTTTTATPVRNFLPVRFVQHGQRDIQVLSHLLVVPLPAGED